MIVRNKGNNTCYFPYAGANGVRGKNLSAGECSEELPVSLLDNRLLKRHWESGYIDILLNASESAIYAKQYKLSPTQEDDLHGKGYSVICRPGTVKRPIMHPNATPVPPQMMTVPPKDQPSDPPTPTPNIPSMKKEGEKIEVKRVLEDPTISPLGSPIDSIPTVIKQPRRIPVEKYQPKETAQPLSPTADPSAIPETPISTAAPAEVAAAAQAQAEAPAEAPAPAKKGKKGKKADKAGE